MKAPSATPIRVGLIGYGRAGQSVARVLGDAEHIDLRWIYRQSLAENPREAVTGPVMLCSETLSPVDLLAQHPVDMIVDFSSGHSIHAYVTLASATNTCIIRSSSDYH